MAQTTPYDAAHVAIVDMGGTVWALYIPNPEQAKDPRKVAANITSREYDSVEVIACAQRYYKRDGAIVPGWVITSGPDYSDPIANKPAMLRHLREHTIPEYFHRPTHAATTNTEEPQMPAATTTDFTPGQQIIVGNGTTQTVVKMADRIGNEPQRVEVEGGLQWLASECIPANDGTTYCGACGDVFATTAVRDTHQNATNHKRFKVRRVGFNQFAVRDTRTGIDTSVSTSRSGARHIADCLTDGTMVLDRLGRAIAAQAPVAPAATDAGEFGVFNEDGECIDGPYYHHSKAEEQAQTYRDEDEDGEYTVCEMCPDHEGHAKDNCQECYAEDEN